MVAEDMLSPITTLLPVVNRVIRVAVLCAAVQPGWHSCAPRPITIVEPTAGKRKRSSPCLRSTRGVDFVWGSSAACQRRSGRHRLTHHIRCGGERGPLVGGRLMDRHRKSVKPWRSLTGVCIPRRDHRCRIGANGGPSVRCLSGAISAGDYADATRPQHFERPAEHLCARALVSPGRAIAAEGDIGRRSARRMIKASLHAGRPHRPWAP
jgi:hypothetical protein